MFNDRPRIKVPYIGIAKFLCYVIICCIWIYFVFIVGVSLSYFPGKMSIWVKIIISITIIGALAIAMYSLVKKQSPKLSFLLIYIATMWSPFIVGSVIGIYKDSKSCSTVQTDQEILKGIQLEIELYYKHYNFYPENLDIAMKEGYIQEGGDRDSWKNKLRYKPLVSKDSKGKADNYLLGSNGPDGKPDTDDDIEPPISIIRHSFKSFIK